jgi:acyl-CoA synthetase (AMP-forming)/AMP-acid ligase II
MAPAASTFVELLRGRSRDDSAQRAFSFSSDGGRDAHSITYAQLDERARAVAALLQTCGLAGERALLVYPPGLDFVAALFGCLYAGWIAVPAYPPAARTRSRLLSVERDARPAVLLTSDAWRARHASEPELEHLDQLATDTLPTNLANEWHAPDIELDDLAILQYTSGSTGAPRGVMLSHANLVHNTRQIERRFEIDSASRGVIWLPPVHDMGLIGGILQGVLSGFPISLMSALAFVRRPARWLEAITRERATISGGPNFAYDLCVDKITPGERATLDLSSWQVAFNGAEPVRKATLDRFAEAFALCGFRPTALYPCYGLAEATLMVAGGERAAAPTMRTLADGTSVVSCGAVVDDQQLAIVDPATRIVCPDGQRGEIWVSGPSVARGYWQQPDLTYETFEARLSNGGGPFLRTGDLGFVHAGELYVTGRLKTLLIVGGRNLHAEDVEHTVASSHSAGWPGGVAAVSIEQAGRERLVVLQEVEPRRTELAEVVRAIRLRVAQQHQVPVSAVVLMRPGHIPRTSSGKVRRHACRDAFLSGNLDALLEWRLATRGR